MTTRLLTLRDVTAITALSRSAHLRLDGRVPFPETDPHRQPGRALGRAGGARLHRQLSPRRHRPPRCIAGMHGDLLRRPEWVHGIHHCRCMV